MKKLAVLFATLLLAGTIHFPRPPFCPSCPTRTPLPPHSQIV